MWKKARDCCPMCQKEPLSICVVDTFNLVKKGDEKDDEDDEKEPEIKFKKKK